VRNSRTKRFAALAFGTCVFASAAQAAVTISNAKTKNMTCTGGVCTPTGGNANLNVGELQTMLASSDVTVKTGAGAVAIGVDDPLTWASTHRLTLDSVEFVHIKAAVVVEGTAGLTLTTNDGGTGGDLVFENGGYVNFWDTNSSLIINGANYTLVKDLPTLVNGINGTHNNFALANSYDASADGTYKRTLISEIGSQEFLEGLGNTIGNLTIAVHGSFKKHPKNDAALIGLSAGVVRDIALTNVSVSYSKASFNGFDAAVVITNYGSIINVNISGVVLSSSGRASGLVDINYGIIRSSRADVQVTGWAAAGLVLDNEQPGIIESSQATGAVRSTGFTFAGGFAGENHGTITNSFATGDVYADQNGGSAGFVGVNTGNIVLCHATGDAHQGLYAGGLVAANVSPYGMPPFPKIVQSYATGSVSSSTSTAQVGGLIGSNLPGSIEQSYATGSVTDSSGNASDQVGGLVGSNAFRSEILQSYSTGLISYTSEQSPPGGLIGVDSKRNNIFADYWDLDTSGISNPRQGAGNIPHDRGITGLSDAQLKSALPAGFDPNVWGQSSSINNGWPYLLANPPQQ